MLLETWLELEISAAAPKKKSSTQAADVGQTHIDSVKAKLPIKVKKRRPIAAAQSGVDQETGEAEGEVVNEGDDVDMTGWEEYYDYVFPDDQISGKGKSARNLKLLEMARKWKKKEEAE